MNVLLVAAASSVHVMRWANAFVGRGHGVHLVTQHDPVHGFDRTVVMHRFPHAAGAGYVLNRTTLKKLIARLRPDVVNAHYASGYGTLAVRVPGIPLVLNVWGSDVYEFPDSGIVQRRLLRRNLRRADVVVSTSHVMAKRTKAVCPGLGPITVVPFGVDLDRFQPRKEASTAPGVMTIGTIKTLAPKYGVDTLIRAFALVRERFEAGTALRLRIVGGGAQANELQALIAHLGLQTHVDMVGPVPHAQVPDELRKLDIYAALSRTDSESFGVAVIEASACSLPVVVSNVGGLPEVVEDGVTGFVVPKDDPESAAQRIMELIASEELRERIGAAGRSKVEREYGWNDCVDRMVAVYEGAIERMRS